MASAQPRGDVPPHEIALIMQRIKAGEHLHLIARDYFQNQGRLSELKNGKRATFKDRRP